MRKVYSFSVLIFFLIGCDLYSQNEPISLFGNKKDQKDIWGFYFGPELKFTKVLGLNSVYGGVKGAILSQRHYSLGLAAGGFVSETAFAGTGVNDLNVGLNAAMLYGGFYLDYVTAFHSPFQVSFPLLLGGGGFFIYEKLETNPYTGMTDERYVEGNIFMVVEPAINLEINLLKKLRVGLGCGYRMIVNSHLERYSDSDLSAFTTNINFKYGIF